MDQYQVHLRERELLHPGHFPEIPAIPTSFHHSGIRMPVCPLQQMRDLVDERVCQQIRHDVRFDGSPDAVIEDLAMDSVEWLTESQRIGEVVRPRIGEHNDFKGDILSRSSRAGLPSPVPLDSNPDTREYLA